LNAPLSFLDLKSVSPGGKTRNFGLDIVRAFSIILVLIAHRFPHQYEIGLVGVQVFFILSGFLIGQILLNDFKNSGNYQTVFKFWKRRWYRTLPLYYLVLILKMLFVGNPYGWKIIIYVFFMQANFIGIDFLPVSWSLVVEEWFYIFLPLATLIFFSKGINPRKFLFYLFGLILFFISVRFFWNYLHKGIIIYQFDCLLIGVLLSLIKLYFQNIYRLLNSVILFIIGFIGVIVLTFVLGDLTNIPLFSPFYRVIWYFLISICIAITIPYIELSKFFNNTVKAIRPIYLFFTWTSILTYSFYLIHASIFLIHFNVSEYLNVIMHAIILYVAAFFIYIFYEHPMMSLRENFSVAHYKNSVKTAFAKI